jgi:hypothetical protein
MEHHHADFAEVRLHYVTAGAGSPWCCCMAGRGHCIPEEQPDELLRRLLEFFGPGQ